MKPPVAILSLVLAPALLPAGWVYAGTSMAASVTPPGAQTTEAAQQAIEQVYGARLRRAKTAADKAGLVALAGQMLADASELRGQPVLQALLLAKAYELGCTACPGYETALKAAEELGRLHPSRRLEADERILAVYELQYHCPEGNAKAAAQHYLDKTRQMAERHLLTATAPGAGPEALDELAAAISLYQRAAFAARAIGPEPQAEILVRIRDLRQLQSVRVEVESLRRQLNGAPGETSGAADESKQVSGKLARLLAIELGDAESAAAYAAKAGDPQFAETLALAEQGPAALAETDARRLGDWYRQQAESATVGKLDTFARAQACYERVLALHSERDLPWLQAKAACGQIDLDRQHELKQRQAIDDAVKAQLTATKNKATQGHPVAANAGAAGGGGD